MTRADADVLLPVLPEPEPAPLRRTLGLARPAAGRLFGAALLGAAAVGAGVGLLATSAWLISRAAQHPSVQALAVAVVGVRFFGLSRGLFRYAERLVGHDAAFRVLGDLRVSVYSGLERLAPAGLPAFRSGDLLARLVDDVDVLQDLMLRVLPAYLIALLVGGAVAGFTAWLLPSAGLLLAIMLILAGVAVPALSRRMARRSESRVAEVRGDLTSSVVDLLRGAPDLIAFGAAPGQLAKVAAFDQTLTQTAAASARTAGVGLGLSALLSGLSVVGALVLGISAVRSGQLEGVLLAVVVLIPLAAFESVAGLPAAGQALERVRRSAARIFDVLDRPVPVTEPVAPVALARVAATLSVRGVSARWPGADVLALHGVDLELRPGQRVAVVGASGSGKSTLAAVLLRFLPYESGSVSLGDVELEFADGDQVRTVIGLAAQDAHVFDTTLAENLRLARFGASADELRSVLSRARLLEFVESLPAGLETEVGEFGAALSGGQRQRLEVARALLADFPILILDEPAEHLDTATGDELTADLLDLTRGHTTLVITHRLAGLEAVDEIVLLERGAVVERGTHAGLLAVGGRYAAVWAAERASDG